jgi:hypothetical protein
MSQKPKMPWLSRGALVVLVGTLLFGIVAPASAQFFGFGGPPEPQQRQQRERGRERGFGWFGGNDTPFFAPFQQQAPKRQAPREDFSRAPASERRDSTAERNVLVLGDSMADWLGYGLDDAYSEQPDMGVIRKHKTVSGLLRYQPKGEPADWAAAAKAILATEKPDAIVVMLGLSDRIAIREPDKADKKGKLRPDGTSEPANPADDADQDIADPGSIAAPERGARNAAGGVADFRDDRWGELYSRKIEEMIAVVKAAGVPVLWVGLPAVRGTKATADMLYLNGLYRDAAGKAGITYVDVWDGFVDEGGRFLQQGPDFEGQIRRLRSYDGVYFTRAGARKLAHYVEREITRLMAARTGPAPLPSEPATPDANAVPGAPPPRPLAGPIVPLVAAIVGTDQLLGGPGVRPVAADPLASRTLVKGEPLSAPAGRADDFAWPRREVGREQARGEPVASIAPASPTATGLPGPDGTPTTAATAAPKPKPKPKPVAAADAPAPSGIGSFFGFDEPRRAQPAPSQRPPAPQPRNGPRPANGGPSASAPGFFLR